MPNNDDGDGDANGVFCVSVAVPQSMKLCTNQMEMEMKREINMRKLCQSYLKLIQLTIYSTVVLDTLTLSWPSDMEVLENENENEMNICFKLLLFDWINLVLSSVAMIFLRIL